VVLLQPLSKSTNNYPAIWGGYKQKTPFMKDLMRYIFY